MNKERELLESCLDEFQYQSFPCTELVTRIKELLAQPEHIVDVTDMIEPVAWMYEWDTTTTGQPTCRYVNMGKDKPNVEANFLARNFIPLYTVPQNHDLREALREALREGYNQGFNDGKYLSSPKQEPLSEDKISELWANKSPMNEFECVRLVEKAHGITGGE
jgi:hypothetical protein